MTNKKPKYRLKRKIIDVIEFYVFAYALFMLFCWPVFGFKVGSLFTIAGLIIGTFVLFCLYCILNVMAWIEKEAHIEFILRSPITYKRVKQ